MTEQDRKRAAALLDSLTGDRELNVHLIALAIMLAERDALAGEVPLKTGRCGPRYRSPRKPSDKRKYGDILRDARITKGWTQEELARRANISRSSVQNAENATTDREIGTATRLNLISVGVAHV